MTSRPGKSPRAIARGLNAEGIPGPGGREWRDTTIRGQPERGTGILNNAHLCRPPRMEPLLLREGSQDRQARRPDPNPQHLWEVTQVPELRIVDDELWQAVRVSPRENVGMTMGADAADERV